MIREQKCHFGIEELSILVDNRLVLLVCSDRSTRMLVLDDALHFDNVLVCTDVKTNFTFTDIACIDSAFSKFRPQILVSVGGGSVIDMGKMLSYSLGIPHITVPTTCGSGAEATHFAVCYDDNGEKHSVSYDDNMLPEHVIFESTYIDSLPIDERRAGMFDSLCQAVEANWTITDNTKYVWLSDHVWKICKDSGKDWLNNNMEDSFAIQNMSYQSGKLINRTKTSIAHAYSYSIAKEMSLKHGEAVMMTFPFFNNIAKRRGMYSIDIDQWLKDLGYIKPKLQMSYEDFIVKIYAKVNQERLKNSMITTDDFWSRELYNWLIS